MGIGEFPQQAENRFRVTKALLAEEWFKLTLVADKSIILLDYCAKTSQTDICKVVYMNARDVYKEVLEQAENFKKYSE